MDDHEARHRRKVVLTILGLMALSWAVVAAFVVVVRIIIGV